MSEVDWKIEPAASSSCAQLGGVHQVAVVAERDRAAVALDEEGLGVGGYGVARRRVAHVADGAVARQLLQHVVA